MKPPTRSRKNSDDACTRDGESLEQIVGYWLQMRNATLAVAESCTGGCWANGSRRSAAVRVTLPAARSSTSNAVKTELAGVPADMIERHGAVEPRSSSARWRRAFAIAPRRR